MKLVEPFKSAQCFFFWKGRCSNDTTQDGDRTFYKVVKKGIFFKKRVLLVWKHQSNKWKPSSHETPPVICAYEKMLIEIEDKDRLALQRDTLSEKNLSSEDKEWKREQAFFVARRAVKRNAMAEHDRNLKESLRNNNVDKLIDAFIQKHREG